PRAAAYTTSQTTTTPMTKLITPRRSSPLCPASIFRSFRPDLLYTTAGSLSSGGRGTSQPKSGQPAPFIRDVEHAIGDNRAIPVHAADPGVGPQHGSMGGLEGLNQVA